MEQERYKLKDFAEAVSTAIQDPQSTSFDKFVGLEHYDSGEPVIKRYQSTELLTSACKEFHKNDILIARRNVYLKRAGIAFFDGLTSGDSIVLRVYEDCESKTGIPYNVAFHILPFVLNSNSFWSYANRHADGMNSKRISKEKVLDYEFDLPPIEEQKRLAEKLWAAYEVKESYKNMIAAIDEMVKAQFVEMYASYSTTPVKNYVEDSFPGEWGSEDVDGNGVKVIRTTNFTNTGKLDLSEVVTRSIVGNKIERKQIHKYDTILERSGGTNDNPVGRVVLFEEEGLYLCNNFTQILRFKNINPIFAFYSLFFFYQTNKIEIRTMGSKTTGIQNLNMSKYFEIGIPNASQDEQEHFVSIASQADKTKTELHKSIESIDKVIKSLINENI